MKKIFIAALLGTTLFSLPFVFSRANAVNEYDKKPERGSISVSYTAQKEVAPDTAEVSIAVKTEDSKSMQAAAQKNKGICDKVYSYLKSTINTSNGDYIKTSNYSAAPRYTYNGGKRNLDKYVVSNNIIVHTKSIDKISTMIDKSLNLGATDVDSLNFSLSEKDAICSDLLSNATKQVRNRADIVASAAGSSVTGIRNIDTSCSVNSATHAPRFKAMMLANSASMDAESAGASDSTAIEAGVVRLYANVNASFYLK